MKNICMAAFVASFTIGMTLPIYAADAERNYDHLLGQEGHVYICSESKAYENFMREANNKPGFAVAFEYEGFGWDYGEYSKPLPLSHEDLVARAKNPSLDGHRTDSIAVLSTDLQGRGVLIKSRWSLTKEGEGIAIFNRPL